MRKRKITCTTTPQWWIYYMRSKSVTEWVIPCESCIFISVRNERLQYGIAKNMWFQIIASCFSSRFHSLFRLYSQWKVCLTKINKKYSISVLCAWSAPTNIHFVMRKFAKKTHSATKNSFLSGTKLRDRFHVFNLGNLIYCSVCSM